MKRIGFILLAAAVIGAAWWIPHQWPRAAGRPAAAAVGVHATDDANAPLVASAGSAARPPSGVYHVRDCRWAKKITSPVYYPTAAAAEGDGLRPCKVCKPKGGQP